MNASLGEIALNHALTHDDGPVDEVLLDNVEGAREAQHARARAQEHGDGPKSERRASQREANDDTTNASSPLSLRERASAMVKKLEDLTREHPRRALAIAAGAGVVVGVSALSVPVLRTLAKRAAQAALAGGLGSSSSSSSSIVAKVGAQALDKLEGMLGVS